MAIINSFADSTIIMALIKSISGIRGTIGGTVGKNLTALDIVECSMAYGHFVLQNLGDSGDATVVIGRDGRITGLQVSNLVANTLQMMGIDVIDLGYSTTPTVEMAVALENAAGGVILTASHNPREWNALKFLNGKGEFISAADGQQILSFIDDRVVEFASVDHQGSYTMQDDYINKHIDKILSLPYIDVDLIQKKKFTVVVDCINSTGAMSIPPLLDALSVAYTLINGEITGEFAHNPEPLPKHMTQLCHAVKNNTVDLGICVDPDVDRLAFVSEDGVPFGEEYTLVAAADFILSKNPGHTVSNLSSTRALADVTKRYDKEYYASSVGEVNVVNLMKAKQAVIGGEGNGGVILPDLHYGRDALVGIAIILNLLAERNVSMSALRSSYPDYYIVKNKIQLTDEMDIDNMLAVVAQEYSQETLNTTDGLKIDFEDGWVHLRRSNTEPIIRVYAESSSEENAQQKAKLVMDTLNKLI